MAVPASGFSLADGIMAMWNGPTGAIEDSPSMAWRESRGSHHIAEHPSLRLRRKPPDSLEIARSRMM